MKDDRTSPYREGVTQLEPLLRQCAFSIAPIFKNPTIFSGRETELIFGETCQVVGQFKEFFLIQTTNDGYFGFIEQKYLQNTIETTHSVQILKSFVYAQPSIKSQMLFAVPFGARLTAQSEDKDFIRIKEGFIYKKHLQSETLDYVSIAEKFIGIPYLWGGRSSFGIDCSGFVQTVLNAVGISAPRDSDQQFASLGEFVLSTPQRGDLVFWQGHVGIMCDAHTLLHANGYTMSVALENFEAAKARIGSPVLGIKRITY